MVLHIVSWGKNVCFPTTVLLNIMVTDTQDGFMDFFDRDRARERGHEHLSEVIGQALRYTAVGAGIVAGLAMFLRR